MTPYFLLVGLLLSEHTVGFAQKLRGTTNQHELTLNFRFLVLFRVISWLKSVLSILSAKPK
jgi:hypothetical protein